ncbi:hypothetical protein [Silvibacterium acidisoli]|uniref:hypothetical protein n=1 Tax=Acidobacteriaceae bacterium ZG23-2 TaxID=2883246 RepID=UPI00406D29F7
MRSKFSAFALVLLMTAAAGAQVKIEPNSTVYIAPMDGFENDLQAAFLRKHVPLIMVSDKDKATLIVEGHNDNQKAGWAKTVFFSPAPSEHASITVKRASDGAIAYAYSVDKSAARHGPQSAAEACAKHLREAIEGK